MSSREDLYPSRQQAEPLWLERQDPVLYQQDLAAAPIAPELIAQYERDGYLVIPELFSAAEVAAMQAELERLRSDPEVLASDEAIRELHSGALRSLFEIHRHDGLFAQLACEERIAGVARFILGGDVYVHQSRMNLKPGFAGREFYWHSDFETWHVEDGMPRMRALSCSVLLTDNDSNNGPLMLVPGSHRHFIGCVGETPENHYQYSLRRQQVGVPDDASLSRIIGRFGIDTATGPAGSVVFFDCNTLHGSNSNITPAPRSNLFYVFNHIDNRLQAPFCAQPPRPAFVAERGPAEPLNIVAREYA
ncbi:ectoine hydroxylase [Marinobacterium rhizophilum]|uniref:Ectoine hydroxylase n=1 Tax=Marinobacterium rhizophilum TaxID=420402 RepID=A0ABY5HE27_9GAMM|nr:ectoine hydroxylase [Marinobacterium rhizophilum]UTW10605.1 ectoine hydroxylase [Marinobacterium rhizophilum]